MTAEIDAVACSYAGLKGRDNERVEFVAACEMPTDYFSCAPTKFLSGYVTSRNDRLRVPD
jgi:hypothetical protein